MESSLTSAASASKLNTTPADDTPFHTLLSRGVSIKAVADWLGHASPTITLDTYAHLMPTDDEVGRSVLDAAFADSSRTVGSAHG